MSSTNPSGIILFAKLEEIYNEREENENYKKTKEKINEIINFKYKDSYSGYSNTFHDEIVNTINYFIEFLNNKITNNENIGNYKLYLEKKILKIFEKILSLQKLVNLINIECEEIKIKECTEKLFINFKIYINNLKSAIGFYADKISVKDNKNLSRTNIKDSWISITTKEFENLRDFNINLENKSTTYWLLCIKDSILDYEGNSVDNIDFKGNVVFTIKGNIEQEWVKCKNNIIIDYNSEAVQNDRVTPSEHNPFSGSNSNPFNLNNYNNILITGFGPSASGKSFLINKLLNDLITNGEKILNLSSDSNSNPPGIKIGQKYISKITISIDGEIFRDNCISYNFVLLTAHLLGSAGYLNADKSTISSVEVVTTLVRKKFSRNQTISSISLLNSSELKNNFKDYLCNDNGPNIKVFKGKYNIYLPDTLSSSEFSNEDINTWKNLNKPELDKFIIGMMIYQTLEETNNSKGTKISGTQRGIESGKKYNPSNYNKSMENGIQSLKELKDNSLFRLIILNSGGKINRMGGLKKSISIAFTDNETVYDSLAGDISKNIEFYTTTTKGNSKSSSIKNFMTPKVFNANINLQLLESAGETILLGGSSRKKLTKKKNKKYNFKKNTQKNKIIKKSRTKKVSKLHKRLSKNKFIKKSRTKKVSKLYKRKSVKK
tara:strand:- start:4357 stop:6345 length:1989 start_codon:yes stop_codon:yes gene_type:complete